MMSELKDFFISYNKADVEWAKWISWKLEEAGYSVVVQVWDFRPGGNFVLDMQAATIGTRQTIAVLSEDYLSSEFIQPEWASAFGGDPTGESRRLLPVVVRECKPDGLLAARTYIKLVGLSEDDAKNLLLDSLKERGKPATPPNFPGENKPEVVPFPGQAGANTANP